MLSINHIFANGCHDSMQKAINFNAISVKGSDYISKDGAINMFYLCIIKSDLIKSLISYSPILVMHY